MILDEEVIDAFASRGSKFLKYRNKINWFYLALIPVFLKIRLMIWWQNVKGAEASFASFIETSYFFGDYDIIVVLMFFTWLGFVIWGYLNFKEYVKEKKEKGVIYGPLGIWLLYFLGHWFVFYF